MVKSPVRIGDDVWIGTKVVVTARHRHRAGHGRGGGAPWRAGSTPPRSVVAGVPGRVLRSR